MKHCPTLNRRKGATPAFHKTYLGHSPDRRLFPSEYRDIAYRTHHSSPSSHLLSSYLPYSFAFSFQLFCLRRYEDLGTGQNI